MHRPLGDDAGPLGRRPDCIIGDMSKTMRAFLKSLAMDAIQSGVEQLWRILYRIDEVCFGASPWSRAAVISPRRGEAIIHILRATREEIDNLTTHGCDVDAGGDRPDIRPGDVAVFCEWNAATRFYTGRRESRVVLHVRQVPGGRLVLTLDDVDLCLARGAG